MASPLYPRDPDQPKQPRRTTKRLGRPGSPSSSPGRWRPWILLVLLASAVGPGSHLLLAESPSSRADQPKELLVIPETAANITFRRDFQQVVGAVPGETWRASQVAVWEVATGKRLFTLAGHRGGIWQLDYDPTGSKLATNDNYAVRLWDLRNRKQILTFDLPSFTRSVVFTHEGKRLATGHDDGRIRLWDAVTGQSLGILKGHTDWVPCLARSPKKNWLASGSIDETVRLWDLASGKQIRVFRGHEWYVSCLAWGPAGKRLVSGSEDRTARIWDVETGDELLKLSGHQDWIRAVAYSPDGNWVATGSADHTLKLWNAKSGAEVLTIDRDDSRVNYVAFSADGRRLATTCQTKTIRLWDVASLVGSSQ